MNIKTDKKIRNVVIRSVVEPLILDGEISIRDLKDKNRLRNKLKTLLAKNPIFVPVIDYRSTLLSKARKAWKRSEYEVARVFFATYFEHYANFIITTICSRNKYSKKVKYWLIRKNNLEDKLGHLLKIFDLGEFNSVHLKTIIKLSDKRNEFLHYKHEGDEKESTTIQTDRIRKRKIATLNHELETIEKSVVYTKSYFSKNFYQGNKLEIYRALNNLLSD